MGFGPSFFYRPDATVRFAGVTPPAGFAQLPPMPHGAAVPADLCFYIVATAEAEMAKFVDALAASGVTDPGAMPSRPRSWACGSRNSSPG